MESSTNQSIILQTAEYRRLRQYREILSLLYPESTPTPTALAEPELCLALALSLSQLRRHVEVTRLLDQIKENVCSQNNESLHRRWATLYVHELKRTGRLGEARTLCLTTIDSALRDKDHRHAAWAFTSLGGVASQLGEVEPALVEFSRGILSARRVGDQRTIAAAHLNSSTVLREWGRLEEAAVHFAYAEDYFLRHGILEEKVHLGVEKTLLSIDLEEQEVGLRIALATRQAAADTESDVLRCGVFGALGRARLSMQDPQGIPELLDALTFAERSEDIGLLAEAHEALAIGMLTCGTEEESGLHLSQAVQLYQALGAEKQAARVERSVA